MSPRKVKLDKLGQISIFDATFHEKCQNFKKLAKFLEKRVGSDNSATLFYNPQLGQNGRAIASGALKQKHFSIITEIANLTKKVIISKINDEFWILIEVMYEMKAFNSFFYKFLRYRIRNLMN